MKTVGNYDFVVREFLAQRLPHGGTSHVKGCGNFTRRLFFEGDTLYSYRRSFPLARIVPQGILINSDRYSVTTAKQRNMVFRYATKPCYKVYQRGNTLPIDPGYLLACFTSEYDIAMRRQHTIVRYGMQRVYELRKAYRDFCLAFDLPIEFDLTKDQWRVLASRYAKYYKRIALKQFAKKLTEGRE